MKPWKPELVRSSPGKRAPDAEPPIANAESSDPAPATVLPVPVQLTAWAADQQLSFFVLASLAAGAVYLAYLIFRPFLTALFVALIVTIACYPLHKWVSRAVRNRTLAALTTTTLAVVLFLVPSFLVSAKVVTEAINVYRSVLQPLGNKSAWPSHIASSWNPLIEKAADQTGMSADQLKDSITLFIRKIGRWLFGMGSSLARGFAQQIAITSLTFVIVFFFLRDTDEFRRGALAMLPLSPNRVRELATCVNQGILANIYGMLAVGVAEGVMTALGFWGTGLRSPLLWGAIATVLSCLPVVGVSLVWIPACVVLALRGTWMRAIILLAWGFMISTAEGMVRSNVVGGRVKANSVLITLSFMGGLTAFGAVGLFVGPVVLALVAALVRILREEHASVQESRKQVAAGLAATGSH